MKSITNLNIFFAVVIFSFTVLFISGFQVTVSANEIGKEQHPKKENTEKLIKQTHKTFDQNRFIAFLKTKNASHHILNFLSLPCFQSVSPGYQYQNQINIKYIQKEEISNLTILLFKHFHYNSQYSEDFS